MIELMLEAERALSMGLVEQAERCYWQAVESDGRNAIAIVGLARVALERGDDRTALEFARKALDVDPENGTANRLVQRLSELASERGGGTEPAPSEPAPSEPAPSEPAPSEPAPERRSILARLRGQS
jgi:tetratricopeptide (TPR) repeat protein